MATSPIIETHPGHFAPPIPSASLRRSPGRLVACLIAWARARLRERRIRAELLELDEDQLRDAGISRHAIAERLRLVRSS